MFDYARAQLYVNRSQHYMAGPPAATRWLAGHARNLSHAAISLDAQVGVHSDPPTLEAI